MAARPSPGSRSRACVLFGILVLTPRLTSQISIGSSTGQVSSGHVQLISLCEGPGFPWPFFLIVEVGLADLYLDLGKHTIQVRPISVLACCFSPFSSSKSRRLKCRPWFLPL